MNRGVEMKAAYITLGCKVNQYDTEAMQEIMESHGGKLTAESEYGKGTTMIMWFPKERPILEYEREEQKA